MTDTPDKKIGIGSYILALLSLIPFFGIIFAAISITIGITKRQYKYSTGLIILGCLGIVLTITPYVAIFHMMKQKDGPLSTVMAEAAQRDLNQLVANIEYYKMTKGQYPASLNDLAPKAAQNEKGALPQVQIYDMSQMMKDFGNLPKNIPEYFYQLAPDKSHYYLLSTGPDQKPFTPDDILPSLPDQDRAKTGLIINTASLPVPANPARP